MANMISLEYVTTHTKLESEQQLLDIFIDLKKQYNSLNHSFKISTITGQPVENFEQFLDIATKEKQSVVLNGSGDICGLIFINASLKYNLSHIGQLTKYWDIHRDGSCHSCHNRYSLQLNQEMDYACKIKKEMDWSHNCDVYNPYLKDNQGKPARKLQEIINEAVSK